TIVALSTPPGRSGIGVVRLSGPHALGLVRKLLRKDHFAPEANRVTLQTVLDPTTGAVLDHALITYFQTPHSFTGEDVVELSCHGSPVLLLQILDALLLLGARAAERGEFTLRALAHGRINLSQAEAIRDLIDARTQTAVRQAARQLEGELSTRLQPIKSALLDIIVPLESSLEFVEDDLPEIRLTQISEQLSRLIENLQELASTFHSGRLLKEGLKVALVGRPNVGKSSVFNSLLKSDRAIVTDIPGTTRDSLSELINIQGVPILLTDTAGLRASDDPIEAIGIERTRRAMVDADLIVLVLDGAEVLTAEDAELLAEARENKYLIALNKNDLPSFTLSNVAGLNGAKVVTISAKTGAGLNDFRAALLEPFMGSDVQEASFLITDARHYDLLRRTAEALRSSKQLVEAKASEDLILVGLYDALRALGEITGETTPENVLSQIFSTFCIGK
ncbi:MAG: tRNA uridine-5-carboxymethylaminomethyl(34) synthesis GTPase MnmE, partial [Pyrinomonadaceae bacterium]|nr:tRNA uridine-5-carboxymethylaminomethyl(34) synthesis GTPase MnmE [Pyrinomonadaceae bacterium]